MALVRYKSTLTSNLLVEMIWFDKRELHFSADPQTRLDGTVLDRPLSVSLQVTRDCNLDCVYCSEIGEITALSLEEVKQMISNLRGVMRIILTGGEPLIRKDIVEIAEHVKESHFEIVSLATNGVLMTSEMARKLSELVDYVDITIDGPRKIHNRIRGDYDAVIDGIRTLHAAGLAFSIVTVIYRENVDSVLFTCQIADALGATKVKIMTPIVKGKGRNINADFLSSDQLLSVFERIKSEKERNGWMPRITLTDWSRVGEGHAILVHPNGDVVASPVPAEENCVLLLGNILKEDIGAIWRKYPYKENHLKKYIEESLYVC